MISMYDEKIKNKKKIDQKYRAIDIDSINLIKIER